MGPGRRRVELAKTAVAGWGGASLLVGSILFLFVTRKLVPAEPLIVIEQRPIGRDVLGFVLAYLLPSVGFGVAELDLPSLGVAAFFSILILWRTDVLHVNPVLALLGYRFLEIQDRAGTGGLLLTKDRFLGTQIDVAGRPAWQYNVIRLTDSVWLHEQDKGES